MDEGYSDGGCDDEKRVKEFVVYVSCPGVGLVLLPAKPVYAEENYVQGFVMDALTLPDGNIGVLYIDGGKSSSGVVDRGNLCYGVFDPQMGSWSAEFTGTNNTDAREASMIIHNDVVHVANTTQDDKIYYRYKTDDGWSEIITCIESNNAGGEGVLSSPDLYMGSDGYAHIVYFDTRGVDDERNSDTADVMEYDTECSSKDTVIYGYEVSKDYVGWERSYALRPAKATDSGDIVGVYREDKYPGYGDSSSEYSLYCSYPNPNYQNPSEDKKRCNEFYHDDIEYSLFDVCGNYALIYDGSQYYVIHIEGQSRTTLGYTCSGEGVMEKYAADMTLDDGRGIYYAAAVSSAENNLLFCQDGEVSLKTAANAIHGSHNKLATVVAGDVQYAIYTNTDGNITIANLDAEGALVEYLPTKEHEDISGVTLTAAGYAKGILSGLVAENGYRINGATPTVSAANQYGDFDAADTVEVVKNIAPETPVTLMKYATSEFRQDSEEAEFTFTRAETPSLEAVQPAANDGKGSIPTTTAHEFTTSDPTEDPDEVSWTACTGAMTDLAPGKYYVRVSAAENVLASAAQEITINAFAPEKEATPAMTFASTGTETATIGGLSGSADDAYEITISGTEISDKTITVNGAATKLTGIVVGSDQKAVLSVVKKGNGITTTDSEAQTIEIHRNGRPSVEITIKPSSIGADATVRTSTSYEYTADDPGEDPDAVTWTACTSNKVKLYAGTYYFRSKAGGNNWLAGSPISITISDPVKQPTPTTAEFTALSYNTGMLTGLEPYKKYQVYVVDPVTNDKSWNSYPYPETSDYQEEIGPLSPGILKIIYQGNYNYGTIDSDPQEITITRAETPALEFVNPTNRGTKGRIMTTDAHEYATTDPDFSIPVWTACNGELTGLNAGTYYVRVKASGHVLASAAQKITLTEETSWLVTFHANGHGETPAAQAVKDQTKAIDPSAAVSETGYTLEGWYTTAACTDAGRWDFNTALESDQDLYAKWSANPYTVKFDKNDPDAAGEMDDQDRVYDDGEKLSKCSFTPQEGKEFSHWSLTPDGTDDSRFEDETTENIDNRKNGIQTLYAQWVDEDWGDLDDKDIQVLKDAGTLSKNVEKKVWIGVIDPVTYTGANIALTPDQLHVYDGKTLLTVNQDYTVKYTNQKNACEATEANAPTVTVTGKGNYEKKTLSAKFAIRQKNLGDADIIWSVKDVPFKEGKVQKQKPVIKYGKLTLKEGTDYDIVSYDPANPTDPGKVKITVVGKGNFTGGFAAGDEPFYHIYTAATDLNKAVITIDPDANLVYPGVGETVCPGITATVNGTIVPAVTSGTENYTIDYKNNDKVGTATVTVTGKNNYCGSKSASFKITAKPVSNANTDIRILGETVYTGKQLKPEIDVYDTDRNLPIPASNYSVTYKNSTNVSDTPDVTVKFKGNYSGTATDTFTIIPCELRENDLQISVPDVKIKKDGDPVKVKPVVKYGKTTLVNGKDYSIEVQEHPEPMYGELWVATVTPKGNYKLATVNSTFKRTFRVYKTVDDIGQHDFEIFMDRESFTYDGNKKTTGITVVARDKYCPGYYGLKEGQDYTITYTNNVNVPADNAPTKKLPTVTVKGKGAYKGTLSKTFEIEPANLETMGENLQITVPDMKCTGKTLKPKVTVTLNGKALKPADYTVTFSDTTAATDHAEATIAGKGNYKGTKKQEFRVYKNDISKVTFDRIADQFYTGSQIRPGERNVPVGDIKNDEVRIYEDKAMTKPLHMGTDYTLEWGENVKTGNGTVIVKGIGEYGFSKTLTFKIKPKKVQ